MADIKVDKSVIRYGKASFIISLALALLTLILYIAWADTFEKPVVMFALWVVSTIILLLVTYQFYKREAYSPAGNVTPSDATYNQRPVGKDAWPFWIMIVAWLLYAGVLIGVGSTIRTDRVENCTPETPLRLEGNPGQGQAWIDFYDNCDNVDVKFDEPLRDYLRANNTKPSWIMTRDGYTQDPVNWWNYYSKHPKNPYDLGDISVQEKNDFFTGSRKLPDRILKQGD